MKHEAPSVFAVKGMHCASCANIIERTVRKLDGIADATANYATESLSVLGINLLDVMPFFRRLQPTLPSSISRRLLTVKALNHSVTPALLGAVTFFLPCGFTQSMQLYSLTTGSFGAGALTMGIFALGTLPVLGLLSFASSGLRSPKASGIFYKASGLVVIGFGAITLLTGLAAAGYLPPIVRF